MKNMLYMFFGDSHIRQFYGNHSGKISINSFSGATVKGLANKKNGVMHGVDIEYMCASPSSKKIFLMFGSVDMDATFHRKYALGEDFSFDDFKKERVNIYTKFVKSILDAGGDTIASINILAPHVTPLSDSVFVEATAKMVNVSRDEMEAAARRVDLSHKARCRRQIEINSAYGEALAAVSRRCCINLGLRTLRLTLSGFMRLCCANPVRDSSRESSMVAGVHEQTHLPDLQDQELASL